MMQVNKHSKPVIYPVGDPSLSSNVSSDLPARLVRVFNASAAQNAREKIALQRLSRDLTVVNKTLADTEKNMSEIAAYSCNMSQSIGKGQRRCGVEDRHSSSDEISDTDSSVQTVIDKRQAGSRSGGATALRYSNKSLKSASLVAEVDRSFDGGVAAHISPTVISKWNQKSHLSLQMQPVVDGSHRKNKRVPDISTSSSSNKKNCKMYQVSGDGACQFRAAFALKYADDKWLSNQRTTLTDIMNELASEGPEETTAESYKSRLIKNIKRSIDFTIQANQSNTNINVKTLLMLLDKKNCAENLYKECITPTHFDLYKPHGVARAICQSSPNPESFLRCFLGDTSKDGAKDVVTQLTDSIGETIQQTFGMPLQPSEGHVGYAVLDQGSRHYSVMAPPDFFTNSHPYKKKGSGNVTRPKGNSASTNPVAAGNGVKGSAVGVKVAPEPSKAATGHDSSSTGAADSHTTGGSGAQATPTVLPQPAGPTVKRAGQKKILPTQQQPSSTQQTIQPARYRLSKSESNRRAKKWATVVVSPPVRLSFGAHSLQSAQLVSSTLRKKTHFGAVQGSAGKTQ